MDYSFLEKLFKTNSKQLEFEFSFLFFGQIVCQEIAFLLLFNFFPRTTKIKPF